MAAIFKYRKSYRICLDLFLIASEGKARTEGMKHLKIYNLGTKVRL